MGARECLICGASFRAGQDDGCPDCDGRHHLAVAAAASERRPANYGPGDHAALLYSSDERCMSVLVPYVRDGVAAGNRVVGAVDDRTASALRLHLTSAEARRVEMFTPAEQYGDRFSADRTYDAWSRTLAATDGILRGFGGLDEVTVRSLDLAEWGRYERMIGGLLRDDALGLCLYDARYCSPELLACGAGHSLLSARDKVNVCA